MMGSEGPEWNSAVVDDERGGAFRKLVLQGVVASQ